MSGDAEKILYTAQVRTVGGRAGKARSSDGRLDIELTLPGAIGGGTNPEQLFAAGWSACFEGAMAIAARSMSVDLPPGTAIDAEVSLVSAQGHFDLRARLEVSLPGLEREIAQALIEAAHRTCPYSRAVRGNIETVVGLARWERARRRRRTNTGSRRITAPARRRGVSSTHSIPGDPS